MKQFGKPRVCMPYSVDTPSCHLSLSGEAAPAVDLVAGAALQRRANFEAAGEDDAVDLVLTAVRDDARSR